MLPPVERRRQLVVVVVAAVSCHRRLVRRRRRVQLLGPFARLVDDDDPDEGCADDAADDRDDDDPGRHRAVPHVAAAAAGAGIAHHEQRVAAFPAERVRQLTRVAAGVRPPRLHDHQQLAVGGDEVTRRDGKRPAVLQPLDARPRTAGCEALEHRRVAALHHPPHRHGARKRRRLWGEGEGDSHVTT